MLSQYRMLLTGGRSLRVLADVVMVNTALAAAMVIRYIWEISFTGIEAAPVVLQEYASDYLRSCGPLTFISLVVFYVSGFYTRGRHYQGRYKAIVVAQAVTLSYLLLGFLAFLSQGQISPPRTVLFLGWGITLVLLTVSRIWSTLWQHHAGGELSTTPSPQRQSARPPSVLVIGGAGYIGSALVPKLLNRGYHVRLLDLFLFGRDPIATVLTHPLLEIVQADFRHLDRVIPATKGIDVVVHLGGIVGDPACALDEALTMEVNLIATRMIAETAKGSGVRHFVFASTCSVYGASEEILDERSELNPLSLYARCKLASEKVLLQLAEDSFSPVILRFGTVYGLSGRTRFDLVVNLLTAKAVVERKITVFGGKQWRPFLHVDDAAAALLRAVEAPIALVQGQIINAGSNEQNYQLAEVARLIQELFPRAQIVDAGANADFRNYRVNFDKLRNILGFRPHWTLQKGIRQVITALESGQVSDYRLPLYSNAKFLSEETGAKMMRSENGWAEELIKEDVKSSNGAAVGAAS
jgi:nucleoside-diphosphate-sugar epimerase